MTTLTETSINNGKFKCFEVDSYSSRELDIDNKFIDNDKTQIIFDEKYLKVKFNGSHLSVNQNNNTKIFRITSCNIYDIATMNYGDSFVILVNYDFCIYYDMNTRKAYEQFFEGNSFYRVKIADGQYIICLNHNNQCKFIRADNDKLSFITTLPNYTLTDKIIYNGKELVSRLKLSTEIVDEMVILKVTKERENYIHSIKIQEEIKLGVF